MSKVSGAPEKIDRPPLYEAKSVPFEKLSPDDFESCVFACFRTIQAHEGLRVDGQPNGSGDGGFDAYGVAIESNRKLCIQCKRLQTSLGLSLLAKEVAKVAMNTHLEGSDVGVHFFICTGGVTKDLRSRLRETDRAGIRNKALELTREDTKGELYTLRERLAELGVDWEEIVSSYVRNLDRLVAWDMVEFEAALSPAWESALQVLEKFFKVTVAVRENPRALFDRKAYQDKYSNFTAAVEPQLEEGELPVGLVDSSAADPGPQKASEPKNILTVKSLAALEPGEAALVVAEGGAGKTTLLELVRAEVARESPNTMLSVLIECGKYTPGALDNAVHAELGVKSGSWRMLPDRVQILCDGINEAPPNDVKVLFSELKPLLEAKGVSCIFTSREDSRAVRIVLPIIPCAVVRLAPFTPGRVRSLARHELAEESEVMAFTDAYRAMAARASGHFMWTPFAVSIALMRWKESRQLGSTLGELLEATVFARAERDLEISSAEAQPDLPKTSVLEIASAMAFEMVVINGQIGCSVRAIGGIFKHALNKCSDVYGADALSSIQFIGLLRKHDLVQLTTDDSFRWSHQLVAGALAAQQLAPHWRQHLRALEQPLADDAWVFATRYIVDSDLDDYLGELFRADLMLGASSAAELPTSERNRALQHIQKALQPEQPEELQVVGLFALARLGTESALSYLREMAKDRQSEIGYQAARALAYSGDRSFLLELGAEVDRCRQMGLNLSGGEIAIWETATLADRIAIARERLKLIVPGEAANESLNLIACETLQEDIPLLESHLNAATDVHAWATALHAIKAGDHDRAQYLLDKALSEGIDNASKAEVIMAGQSLGLQVDADEAFSHLVELCAEESKNSEAYRLGCTLVENVFKKLPLTKSICHEIESQLSTSAGAKKSIFWQLANQIESRKLALVALDTFTNDLESVGMAANYFLAHKALREEHRDFLQAKIEHFLTDKSNWYTFDSWRALSLAAELGLTPSIAELLQNMILRLSELRELVEAGTEPNFEESEQHIADGFKTNPRFDLQRYAGYLVDGALGAVEVLSAEILLKFLHFDLPNHRPGREIVNAFRGIDSDLLDGELALVQNKSVQRGYLELVCEFGLTDQRFDLLREHLEKFYCYPAALGPIEKALEKCWDSRACAMVVETVAAFEEWPEKWQPFFSRFIRMVDLKVTGEDRKLIEHHLALAKTDYARRILRIWRQATIDSRVGLSRLEG